MVENAKSRRFGYLEDEEPLGIETQSPQVSVASPPVDFIDLRGTPITPPKSMPATPAGGKSVMETRGEAVCRVSVRILWVIVRIAIGFAFFYFLVRGTTCQLLNVKFT